MAGALHGVCEITSFDSVVANERYVTFNVADSMRIIEELT